jgi:hypothetical protein
VGAKHTREHVISRARSGFEVFAFGRLFALLSRKGETMKATQLFTQLLAGCLLITAACAQAPQTPSPVPAASNAGMSASDDGRVQSIIYAPRGEVQALVLRDETVVTLPPDLGSQVGSVISRGTTLHVTGQQQLIGGQKQIVARNIQIGSQKFVASAPAPPPPGTRPRRNRPGIQSPPPPGPPPEE